ncbi:MAG: radical SAM family heme chaperone HemW [Myxococcota bacterium]
MSAPGLYVHVPFCARACPYCDFDFQVGRTPPVAEFLAALERECRLREVEPGLGLRTVYIGGGTPSMLGPEGMRQLLRWIGERFDLREVVERTVELNPEHIDEALLDALREQGVDRVSLGVQSLGTDALAELGRVHRAEQARRALVSCVEHGLRVSADLIVGWPGQTRAQLLADLAGVLETGIDHLSIYALTVEPGTPWERLAARGRRGVPDADAQADRLSEAAQFLGEAGFEHYEVASYCRPGARAQHNHGYWTWRDYLGLGPSAASARHCADGSVHRRTNRRGFGAWAAAPNDETSEERLEPGEAAVEGLWVGLRALDGFEVAAWRARFPVYDEPWLRAAVARQLAKGNLDWTNGVIRVAEGRWLWHDEIGADLLTAG